MVTNLLKRRHPNIAAVALAQQKRTHRVGAACPRARVPGRLYADPEGRVAGKSYGPQRQNRRTHHRLLRRSSSEGKQVRPWLAKSRMAAAPRVRESNRKPISKTHQGQRQNAAAKVRMYWCNLFLQAITNRKPGQVGASMYSHSRLRVGHRDDNDEPVNGRPCRITIFRDPA